MKNIEIKIIGDKLNIEIDLTKTFGRSKSGKTTIIASTEGNQTVPAPSGEVVSIGVNVYKK